MKAVVASLVVIALALTAVSGVTYSWFSDTEESTITVSTANVDYDVIYTPAKVSGDSEISPLTSGKEFAITNLAANAEFTITPSITNKSTIDTIYRIYVKYNLASGSDIDDNDLQNILVNGTPLLDNDKIVVQPWTPVAKPTGTDGEPVVAPAFTISTPSTYAATSAHTGLTITVVLEAYQGSYAAPVDPTAPVVVPDSGVISGQVPISGAGTGSEDKAQVVVTFPDEVKGKEFETTVTKNAENKYTISATLDGGSATFFNPVTMTVTLPGNLEGSNVIYLGTSGDQPTIVSMKYNGTATVITFTTTHFSEFMVAKDVVAIADIEDSKVGTYDSLSDAITNVDNGGRVVLVKDVTIDTTISTNKNFVLDLNGKNITGNGVRVFNIQSGDVSLDGNGVIKRIDSSVKDSSTIRVGDGWYDDSGEKSAVKLNIGKGVTVEADLNNYGISIMGTNTSLILDISGTVKSSNYPAISGNGGSVFSSTTITIEETAIVKTGDNPAIYHPQAGTLTVKGTVNGGIEAKAGEINIEDSATVSSNSKSISHIYNSNGPSSNGYAIAIVTNAAYKGPAHLISDKATINGSIAYLLDDKTITGEIAALAKTSDDKYFFDTLELVTEFAPEGSTIVLLKDADVQKITIENKTITLNLNGHNINLVEKIYVQSTGSLDIIGKGIISSETQGIRVQGSDNPEKRNHLTVGKDVTVNAKQYYSVYLVPLEYEKDKLRAFAYSDITLEGTFNAGLFINGQIKNTDDSSTLSILGATVNGSSYLAGYSIFHADNVKFTSDGTPLLIKAGNITIENSSISSTLVYDAIPIYASSSNGDLDSNCLIKIDNKAGYAGVSSFKLVDNTYSGHLNTYVLVLYEGTEPTGYTYDLDKVHVLDVDKSSAIAYIDNVKVEIDGTIYTVTLYFDSYETAKTYFDSGNYADVFGASAVVKEKGTLSPAPSSSA